MSDFVRLHNPDTGGVWDCPADYEDIARARGWVDTDKPLPADAAEAKATKSVAPPKPVAAPEDAPVKKPAARKSTAAKSAKSKE